MLDLLAQFTQPLTLEILLIAFVITLTTALPGLFLILEHKALTSDATAHAVLLGIVVSFFLVKDLYSPLLFLGAVLAGVLASTLVEWLLHLPSAPFVTADSALVVTFSLFFSLALIFINFLGSDNVHIDEDIVILGDLAFTPFIRTPPLPLPSTWGSATTLPLALVRSCIILLCELILLSLFFKELILASFDPLTTRMQGFSKRLIDLGLIGLSSLGAVNAMENLGTFVTIAFFILPPAAGLLLSQRLSTIFLIMVLFILWSLPIGYASSYLLNSSISGSMAFVMAMTLLGLVVFKLTRK